jgi:hypothetical protein
MMQIRSNLESNRILPLFEQIDLSLLFDSSARIEQLPDSIRFEFVGALSVCNEMEMLSS